MSAVKTTKDELKDEPDWVVEQVLRRRHEELVTRWEQQEQKLQRLRQEEKAQEARGSKRRRIDDAPSSRTQVDEDAEWLLDDQTDAGRSSDDPFSGLSATTREILGITRPKDADEDDAGLEPEIKVRMALNPRFRASSNLCRFTIPQERTPSSANSSLSSADQPSHRQYLHP